MKKTFFVLAAVIISIQLSAQDSLRTANEKEMDPVVISATKFPVKTSLTGKVINVITKEQLERSGGKDLSQVLSEQAGIFIAGANSNIGKDKSFYLRGARIDHTLIIIDGIPVYDPSGIGGNFDLRNLSVNNIERIEILKGSQSTLYGSDAIAGVINIITRKNAGKKISGIAGLSYGSYQTFKGNAAVNGRKDKVDYNISYSLHKADGINEAVSNNSFANTDRDGYTQNSLQLGFGFKATSKVDVQPFFRYNNIKGDLDQGAFTDELDYTYSQKSWQAGFKNQFSIGKSKLYFLYSFNNISRVYIDDSVKSRNGFDTYSKGQYKGVEHFADLFITASLHKHLKLTAGIDYRSSKSDQEFFSVGFFGPFTSKYGNDSLHQSQIAVYAAMNFNGKSGFNMEAGSRINFHSAYGNHAVFNFNPSYLINEKLKLFVSISSAYRTPSLYQLYSEYGNKKLKPESAITAEGGLQYYMGNKFSARVALFSRNVKNVLFFYTNPSTFASQYINQDKQKDKGAELEASYSFSKNIALKVFYTYVTGEINTKTGAGKDTVYYNLFRRPKNSFGLNISSRINERLFISSHVSAYGKRTDRYFDATTFQTVNAVLKSYVLWDMYAEYSFVKNKLKLFADFRNILNSRYTEISGFNTTGLNINGGFRFNF